MTMRHRVLLAASLLLIGALFLVQVGLAFPPRGGASSGPGGGSLVALLATMPPDSWQQLNASAGSGQPFNLLSVYNPGGSSTGFTMCNYDGLPPASCSGGSGSGDFWQGDANVAGSADGGGGVNPGNSAAIFAFSSPAMRPTDGLLCGLGMGGHAASLVSAVLCFDPTPAVADLVAQGGAWNTKTQHGLWTMPVGPGRIIGGVNPKPSWSPELGQSTCSGTWSNGSSTITLSGCVDQYGNAVTTTLGTPRDLQNGDTACFTGTIVTSPTLPNITVSTTSSCSGSNVTLHFNMDAWITTNVAGQNRPVSCHTYWTNQWLGGDNWTNGGGAFCPSWNGTVIDTDIGGIEIFNSTTGVDTFPLGALSATKVHAFSPSENVIAYDGLSGNGCVWAPTGQVLNKWCNPTSSSTALTLVHNSSATSLSGNFAIVSNSAALIIPDPIIPGGYAFLQYAGDPGTSASASFTEENGTRHPSVGSWTNPTANGLFLLWSDIYGTPKALLGQFASVAPSTFGTPGSGTAGTCYHAGLGKPLIYKSGKSIYQINTSANLYGSNIAPALSDWTITAVGTGAGGSNPAGGPVVPASGPIFSNCVVLSGLNAEVVYVPDGNGSNTVQVWLHKDGAVSSCPAPTQIGGIIFPSTPCILTDGLGVTYQFCDFNVGCPTVGTFLFRNNNTFAPNISQVQLNTAGGSFPTGRLFRLSTNCTAIPAEPSIWFMDQFPQAINPTSAPLANYFHNTTKGTSGLGFGLLQSGSVGDHYTFDTLQAGISIYATASRLGPNNNSSVITFASGSIAGCAQDEGNAILPVDTGGGPVDNITFTGPGIIGHEHDLDSAGLRCINYGTGTNLTIIGLTITDCDFGLQDSVVASGTTTLTNVLFDGSGGHSQNNSSATHNVYLNNFLADSTSKVTVSGGGSYCTNGDDGGGPGFEFKTRFVAGTFANWTAAEPSQVGSSRCQESAAVDISCGGNYVLGGAGAGQGVVLEVNHISGNGNEIVRYGRDQRASTGGVNCAIDTITASATGGVITVTAFSGHWNLGVVNEFAYANNDFTNPLGFFSGTTISGSGGVGQYGFSNTTFGSQSLKVGVQHGWSDAECQAAVSQNCTLLIQNCWLINDSGNAGSTKINLSVVTIDSSVPANVVTVKNCKLVGNGSGAALTLGTGVIDGGGNTTYADRTAAGLSAYPALPAPP